MNFSLFISRLAIFVNPLASTLCPWGLVPQKGVIPPLSACRILMKGVNPLGVSHLKKCVNPPLRLIFGTQWAKMEEFV